jgi:RIO kinase 1
MNHGVIARLGPPIRQGKESLVVQGVAPDARELAIKVHTSKVFGKRERKQYLFGDWRYRHAKRHITLRTEAMWTEKEYRNLARLEKVGIPAPRPVGFEENIVVMTLLGGNGVAAPQLNELESGDYDALSKMVLAAMERLVSRVHLVHGDLSPYNIVVWDRKPFIIDVSQAVLVGHPDAARLLENDFRNVAVFFELKDVDVEDYYRVGAELTDDVKQHQKEFLVRPTCWIRRTANDGQGF